MSLFLDPESERGNAQFFFFFPSFLFIWFGFVWFGWLVFCFVLVLGLVGLFVSAEEVALHEYFGYTFPLY